MGIKIDDLFFTYEKKPVLCGINIMIEKGEMVGIIGPNGSGKTTLLKCLSRVLDIVKGRITIDGQEIQELSREELARRVAVVPQMTSIAFGFTVREMVLMGRTPHLGRLGLETKDDLELAETNIKLTGLEHLGDRMVTDISGGELQRAVIARALTQQPEYLLLDEPTSHLDIYNQLEILDLIRDLNAQNRTTIIAVFHDINLAARYCERLIMMKEGRIAIDGPTVDVLKSENIRNIFSVETDVRVNPIIQKPTVDVLSVANIKG
jgi:iron complex transport system ATP-binding protein